MKRKRYTEEQIAFALRQAESGGPPHSTSFSRIPAKKGYARGYDERDTPLESKNTRKSCDIRVL